MTLSFLGYEFGKNPEVQQKLQDEIDQAFDENGGEMPDYATIQGRVAKIIYSYLLDLSLTFWRNGSHVPYCFSYSFKTE